MEMDFTIEEMVVAHMAYAACALSIAEDKALDSGRERLALTEQEQAEAKILRMEDGGVAWAMSDQGWQERARAQSVEREVDRDLLHGLARAIESVPRWTMPWKTPARQLYERCDEVIGEMEAERAFSRMPEEARLKALAKVSE